MATIKVRNLHTSAIDHIAKGAEGEIEHTPGVQHLIDTGLLERTDGGISGPVGSTERAPTLDEGRAMMEELDRRGTLLRDRDARIRELELEVAELRAKKRPSKTDDKVEG